MEPAAANKSSESEEPAIGKHWDIAAEHAKRLSYVTQGEFPDAPESHNSNRSSIGIGQLVSSGRELGRNRTQSHASPLAGRLRAGSEGGGPDGRGMSFEAERAKYLQQNAEQRRYLTQQTDGVQLKRTNAKDHITGLIDQADEEVLRLSLHLAAGRPRDTARAFEEEDRATWSMRSLDTLTCGQLGDLQQFAGPDYTSLIHMPVNLIKLDSSSTNNLMPFSSFLFPTDKYNLTHSTGRLVEFKLDSNAFDSGTESNSRKVLQEVRQLLFDIDRDPTTPMPSSFTLKSSPLQSVTLPDAARQKAAIPQSARFYSFCYPVVLDESLVPVQSEAYEFATSDYRSAFEALKASETLTKENINLQDPFIQWLCTGAFVYFDFSLTLCESIAIVNALQSE